MTRVTVTVEGGKHMTATEKRALIAVIDYMRGQDPATWGTLWAGYKRSPKDYTALPDPEIPGRYSVGIRTRYRTDRGEPREQISYFMVRIAGIDPLPSPKTSTPDLFTSANSEAEQ